MSVVKTKQSLMIEFNKKRIELNKYLVDLNKVTGGIRVNYHREPFYHESMSGDHKNLGKTTDNLFKTKKELDGIVKDITILILEEHMQTKNFYHGPLDLSNSNNGYRKFRVDPSDYIRRVNIKNDEYLHFNFMMRKENIEQLLEKLKDRPRKCFREKMYADPQNSDFNVLFREWVDNSNNIISKEWISRNSVKGKGFAYQGNDNELLEVDLANSVVDIICHETFEKQRIYINDSFYFDYTPETENTYPHIIGNFMCMYGDYPDKGALRNAFYEGYDIIDPHAKNSSYCFFDGNEHFVGDEFKTEKCGYSEISTVYWD